MVNQQSTDIAQNKPNGTSVFYIVLKGMWIRGFIGVWNNVDCNAEKMLLWCPGQGLCWMTLHPGMLDIRWLNTTEDRALVPLKVEGILTVTSHLVTMILWQVKLHPGRAHLWNQLRQLLKAADWERSTSVQLPCCCCCSSFLHGGQGGVMS